MAEGGFNTEFAVGPELRSFRHSPAQISHCQSHWAGAVLLLTDIVVLEFCLLLGYLAYFLIAFPGQWLPIDLMPLVNSGIAAGLPVVTLCFYMMGLYPGYGISDVERLKQQETGIAIIFSCLLIWDYMAQGGIWSHGVLLSIWFFAALLIPPSFALARYALSRLGRWGMPVVIVGAGDTGERLIELMQRDYRLGLSPAVVLDPDARLVGGTVAGVPVYGTVDDAADLAASIKVCAIALPGLEGQDLADLSGRLPFPHVVVLPNVGNLPSAWVSPRDVGGALGLEIKKNLLLDRNQVFKRLSEIALCIPLLLFCIPVMATLGLMVYLVSPGRIFYSQEREGLNGRTFRMFKIRSMYPDAEERLTKYLQENPEKRAEWERRFKLKDDPRVLPVIGKLLRKSSLDELPQLINVLLGDMSLVGPRPFPNYHLNSFPSQFRDFRCSVRPGLTGLWQVEVRSDGDLEDLKVHDTYYIRNWSLWLDLFILFRTVGVVMSRRGAE